MSLFKSNYYINFGLATMCISHLHNDRVYLSQNVVYTDSENKKYYANINVDNKQIFR